MNPTEILMEEHRVIEQVLECLEKMVTQAIERNTLDPEPAGDAIAFFQGFADRCHHGKEEVHLFPLMEAKGFPREGGPTGQMRWEHEQGRSHVRGMHKAIEQASSGEAEALKTFVAHARSFITLLREHIQKEDHCLFPMAHQVLSEQDQRTLMERFERVESEEMGQGTHEKFHAIANRLANRYGVQRVKVPAARCCGH